MSDKTTSPRRPGWRRPPGPVNVWRIVEGAENQENGTKRPVRFSIQEVAVERPVEALHFMVKYYLVDEPIYKCCVAKNDPKCTQDHTILWKYCLEEQGIVEAAYVIDFSGRIFDLVAINMLVVCSDETREDIGLIIVSD